MPAKFRERFAQNFSAVCDRAGIAATGYGRIKALAALFEVSTTTIQKWLTASALPEMHRLPEICAQLQCSLDDLFYGLNRPDEAELFATRMDLHAEGSHQQVCVPSALFARSPISSGQVQMLRVPDETMSSYLLPNEVAIFAPIVSKQILTSSVYVLRFRKHFMIRRLQELTSGAMRLLCDNTLFQPEDLPKNQMTVLEPGGHHYAELEDAEPDRVFVVGSVVGRILFR